MNFKKTIILLIILIFLGGIFYYFYFKNSHSNKIISKNENTINNYNTSRIDYSENSITNNSEENQSQNQENNKAPSPSDDGNSTSTSQKNETKNNSSNKKETEIASFTTKIYTKDSERQKNVSITCNSLNDTIVENGKTFSFCNTVGKATSSKGYQKADVFKNGEKIKALGGGNCQVSSTLYNAVLKIPELKVTERHAHSNDVPYVKKGKDAAVSYGTYDFKFANNTGNDIKIKCNTDKKNVNIQILKLE